MKHRYTNFSLFTLTFFLFCFLWALPSRTTHSAPSNANIEPGTLSNQLDKLDASLVLEQNMPSAPILEPDNDTAILANRYENGRLSLYHNSVFGPDSCTAYGDPFSPLNSPWHNGLYTYVYQIRIPANYPSNEVRVELFDPDSINSPSNTDNVLHTSTAINQGLPIQETLSCGSNDQRNTCMIDTGEQNLVGANGIALDDVNLLWMMRADENRGSGISGVCGNPPNYDPTLNTQTVFALSYQTAVDTYLPLATYTGQTGDGIRDTGDHQTDLRWVSPGAPVSFGVDFPHHDVPVDDGSPATFQVDLTTDTPNIYVDPVTGDRLLRLEVTAVSGASENGFAVWAGPADYAETSPSHVNLRNIQTINTPGAHTAQGVVVEAINFLPMNSNFGNRFDMTLTEIGPEYAGQTILVSLFDTDSGASPPISFYFDSIDRNDWEQTFAVAGIDDPDGIADGVRCVPGTCNNQWVSPMYALTIPGDFSNCDWLAPTPEDCTPFTGGNLIVNYQAGSADSFTWQVHLPEPSTPHDNTQSCAVMPIAVYDNIRSVTPPGTGANPYPNSGDFSDPDLPPTYQSFVNHVPDVSLDNAPAGTVFRLNFGSSAEFLLWNVGRPSSANTFEDSLTWPGNSLDYADHGDTGGFPAAAEYPHIVRGYVNPLDNTDTTLQTNDWIPINTGTLNSNSVRVQLNNLIDSNNILRLPVYDELHMDGNSGRVKVERFARFQLHGHRLQNWILATFEGWDDSCGAGEGHSDLVISQPQPHQTTILEQTPIIFTVSITNTGSVPITDSFSVDLFLNPDLLQNTSIPLTYSVASQIVPHLDAGASQQVTLTLPQGITTPPSTHLFYAMVDSMQLVDEQNETNNISVPRAITPLPIVPENSLLAVYAWAFDNKPHSVNNLAPQYEPMLQQLVLASEGVMTKTAVILADLPNTDDTHILVIQNGQITEVDGLPNSEGLLDLGITEYNMADGEQLGHFLNWVTTLYPTDSTTFSFVGHGTPLAPETNLSNVFPAMQNTFPTHYGANPDFTDYQSRDILSPYDLAQALAQANTTIDVLDLVQCFGLSIEEVTEVAPYATTIVGSPNYIFLNATMIGQAFEQLEVNQTPQQMASTIVDAYHGAVPAIGHPRILVAIESAGVTAVKDAWNNTASHLITAFNNDEATTRTNLLTAYQASAKYDTSFCAIDWTLNAPDALSDFASFAEAVRDSFGASSDIGQTAELTRQQLNNLLIHQQHVNGSPWFAPNTTWQFDGMGISLYTDFSPVTLEGGLYRNWQSHWYNNDVSADNPHPYQFLQGDTTWADVQVRIWEGQSADEVFCTPYFPAIGYSGELALIDSNIVNSNVVVGEPVWVLVQINAQEATVNPMIEINIYDGDTLLHTEQLGAGYLPAGTTELTLPLTWEPTTTATGEVIIETAVDADNRIWETNEDNNEQTRSYQVNSQIYLPFITR